MNYPAASHGVSKARTTAQSFFEASFGVWTRGAITLGGGDAPPSSKEEPACTTGGVVVHVNVYKPKLKGVSQL